MDVWKIILIAAAVGVAFGIIGFILGGLHRKRVAEAAIGSATKEANRIVSEAMTQAEAKKKEILLEAKEESIKLSLKPRMRSTSREAKTKKNCAKGAMKFSARSAESFKKKRASTRRSRISKRRTRPSAAR